MSVYNSNISTKIVDPVYDKSNFRTEFRLPAGEVYLSNMRLGNYGLNTTSPTLPGTGAFCMQSIQIYDGNQLLDQVLEATLVKNFEAYNNTNDSNLSVECTLSRNAMGYLPVGNQTKQGGQNIPDPNDIEIVAASADNQGSRRAWLSLKNFLPFLGASLYVPSTIFKNLRIVINWKSDLGDRKNLIRNANDDVDTYEDTFLIVDQMNNDQAVDKASKAYKGVVYKCIEHDSVYVPQINPPADGILQQDNKFLVNGFNNKSVSSFRVTQTPLQQDTWRFNNINEGFSNQGSVAQWGTEYQFRVNGSNKLPRNGYDRRNQRLAQLTDTYGICNLPFLNYTYIPALYPILPYDVNGELDYTGCNIDDRVNELIVEMKRTGVAGNPKLNQALRLNMFGEVTKAVSLNKDGSYVVSYI